MIKTLNESDAPLMSDLHSVCFDQAWSIDDMKAHTRQDICKGSLDNGLRSFVIIRQASDQADILTIAVHPDYRRQGLAQSLLTQGEESVRALGVKIIFLEVAEDNASAIRFYEKSQYVRIGRRPAYYRRESGRVAALTYRKDLDGVPTSD